MSYRTTVVCYEDTHGYGWRHVDLFVHDAQGREVNWVYWEPDDNGPESADDATCRTEPLLRRTTPWVRGVGAGGAVYWTAEAAWADSAVG